MEYAIKQLHEAHDQFKRYQEKRTDDFCADESQSYPSDYVMHETYMNLNQLLIRDEFYKGMTVEDIVACNSVCRVLAEKLGK